MSDQEVFDSQIKAESGSRREHTMRTATTIATEHVDLISSKPFEKTVKDLTAELGKTSTEKLMGGAAASHSNSRLAATWRRLPRSKCRRRAMSAFAAWSVR